MKKKQFKNQELENLLKYSKIVKALNTPDASYILYGKDPNIVLEVSDILKNPNKLKRQSNKVNYLTKNKTIKNYGKH